MAPWLIVLLSAGGSMLIGGLLGWRVMKCANLRPYYKGLLLGALSALGVLVLYFLLRAFGVDLFRGAPKTVFEAVVILGFVGIAACMIFVRRNAGREIMDLGPAPLRKPLVVCGATLLLVATVGLIGAAFHVGQALVQLAQGLGFLALGCANTQIRRRGVYHGGSLVPWTRIARYEWSAEGVLWIDLDRPRWWQERVQLPVPAHLRASVDEIMRNSCRR